MEILVCGTAAAEGWPALFCSCEPCVNARKLGGKNLRSRSAYMIGETIRIDFGPDSNLHQQQYGLALEKLEHLLVSHSHWDHWNPQGSGDAPEGFRYQPESAEDPYGNDKVRTKIEAVIGAEGYAKQFAAFQTIKAWEPIALPDGITATPLLAAHDRSEMCVNWMLEQNGKRFLQGHDTGWWDEETWNFLSNHPVDIVVMDCTYGQVAHAGGHLGCANVVEVRDRLLELGALREGRRFIATHFSHNGVWLHHELEAYFKPHGIEVAFDGMKIQMN